MFCVSFTVRQLAVAATVCVTACSIAVPVSVTRGTSAQEFQDDPSLELKRQSDAMTRTLTEAVAVGAAIGAASAVATGSGGRRLAYNVASGGAAGLATGGYVGMLQKRYADSEARLAKVQRDLNEANANALASIQTLERLVALHEQTAYRDNTLAEDHNEANRLIEGYQRRKNDFAAARALQLSGPESEAEAAALDPQISLLQQRIETMRSVAQSLAG